MRIRGVKCGMIRGRQRHIGAWQIIMQNHIPRQRSWTKGMSWGVGLRLHVQAQVLGRSVDSEGGDYGDEGIDS